ncbi:MAG: hypothetical protein U5L04_01035 [Trueperaceae bacterium]|nr:hypothetical protein [Trueperaceae bacterium]
MRKTFAFILVLVGLTACSTPNDAVSHDIYSVPTLPGAFLEGTVSTISTGSTQQEAEAILSGAHKVQWVYFTDDDPNGDGEHNFGRYNYWYVARPDNLSPIYALTPIEVINNVPKAGWGTVDRDAAGVFEMPTDLNAGNLRMSIDNDVTNNTSPGYYDAGLGKCTTSQRIVEQRQKIGGQTVNVAWYFFRVEETGKWYIVNLPNYELNTRVFRLNGKPDAEGVWRYDWIPIPELSSYTRDFYWDDGINIRFQSGAILRETPSAPTIDITAPIADCLTLDVLTLEGRVQAEDISTVTASYKVTRLDHQMQPSEVVLEGSVDLNSEGRFTRGILNASFPNEQGFMRLEVIARNGAGSTTETIDFVFVEPIIRETPITADPQQRTSTDSRTSLVIGDDGFLYGWGENKRCVLGRNADPEQLTPIRVNNLQNVTDVVISVSNTYALSDGNIYSLADGTCQPQALETPLNSHTVVDIAGGIGHRSMLALTLGGEVWHWSGTRSVDADAKPVALPEQAYRIEVGAQEDFAIVIGDDHIWGWGNNSFGQLGLGNTTSVPISQPQELPFMRPSGDSSIAAGGRQTLYLRRGSKTTCESCGRSFESVKGSGSNLVGELGGAGEVLYSVLSPETVASLGSEDYAYGRVAAGEYESFIIIDDRLLATGNNDVGQLGIDPANNEPFTGSQIHEVTEVTALRGVRLAHITSYFGQTLAITHDGEVYTWGRGYFGDGQDRRDWSESTHVPQLVSLQGGGGSTPEVKVTLTVNVSGSGNVSINGETCNGCTRSVTQDSSVDLQASPSAGYSVNWTGCTSSSGNGCTVNMTSDKTVSATFTQDNTAPNEYRLSVSISGDGRVTSSPSGIDCLSGSGTCSGTFAEGTSVTLQSTAGTNSTFSGWGGTCSGSSCTVTMSSNLSVSASFTTDTPSNGFTIRFNPQIVTVEGITCNSDHTECNEVANLDNSRYATLLQLNSPYGIAIELNNYDSDLREVALSLSVNGSNEPFTLERQQLTPGIPKSVLKVDLGKLVSPATYEITIEGSNTDGTRRALTYTLVIN